MAKKTFSVQLTVRLELPADKPDEAWDRALHVLEFALEGSAIDIVTHAYRPSSVHETLLSRQRLQSSPEWRAKHYHECVMRANEEGFGPKDTRIWTWEGMPEENREQLIRAAQLYLED